MKLISMTDFVLEQSYPENLEKEEFEDVYTKIHKYSNFLKQPLELWMFVPCDEEGNVLDAEPCSLGMFEKGNPFYDVYLESKKEWDEAKERCLFEDVTIKTHNRHLKTLTKDESTHLAYSVDLNFQFYGNCKTIENLVKYNLKLTQTAIKQIGL